MAVAWGGAGVGRGGGVVALLLQALACRGERLLLPRQLVAGRAEARLFGNERVALLGDDGVPDRRRGGRAVGAGLDREVDRARKRRRLDPQLAKLGCPALDRFDER